MSPDDYSVQNIYKYSRKSHKKSRNGQVENYLVSSRDDNNLDGSETSPRSERFTSGTPGCSCDTETEVELAYVLHKCPVIALAQQQIQKLLDETDLLLCDNTRCCRSVFDFLQLCKDALWNNNKCKCCAVVIMFCVFVLGLILGAATCGSSFGKFNSPILTCIDNFFISDTYQNIEDTYRSIV